MYYFNPQISGTGLASTEFGCTKFYVLANGIALASIALVIATPLNACIYLTIVYDAPLYDFMSRKK